jgi:hypothetical protein
MTEMMEQQTRKSSSSSYDRRKQVQYACGCKYTFDHHITLEHICPEHETELVTFHC